MTPTFYDLLSEACAHYVRGFMSCFFLILCFRLRRERHADSTHRWLYYATLAVTLAAFKDMVFVVPVVKDMEMVNAAVQIVDLATISVVTTFFLEAVFPGRNYTWVILCVFMLQLLLLPLSAVIGIDTARRVGYIAAQVLNVGVSLGVAAGVIMRRRYIKQHLSYSQGVDVTWVLICCLIFFVEQLLYSFAFYDTTWTGEAVYDVVLMLMWTFMYKSSRHLAPLRAFARAEAAPLAANEAAPGPAAAADGGEPDMLAARYELIEKGLARCMMQEKLYLRTNLSIFEVAQAVGTNKTYLSDYLNNRINTSFYDYINELRVEYACRLIERMDRDNRLTMGEVAQACGFGSDSTFHRQFVRTMDVTPKKYYRQTH